MSESQHSAAHLPGLCLDPVTRWPAGRISSKPPLTAELIAGGRSNLTFRLLDAAVRRWALRRPPAGALLSAAHNMGREQTVLTAVAQTAVPAPTSVAVCEDDAVAGAPFYVMGWIDALVPAARTTAGALMPQARAALTDNLGDVFSALHALEPDQLGLTECARPADYLESQSSRSQRQLHQADQMAWRWRNKCIPRSCVAPRPGPRARWSMETFVTVI